MKKILFCMLIVVFAASMIFAFAACKEEAISSGETTEEVAPAEEEAAAEEAPEEEKVVGICFLWRGDAFQEAMWANEHEIASKNNIKILEANSEATIEGQVTIIEDFISAGVDSIIIQPIGIPDATDVAQVCEAAGIPVVFYHMYPDPEESGWCAANVRLTEVKENFEAGAQTAKLWKELHPDKPIVMIQMVLEENEYCVKERSGPTMEGVLSVDPDAIIYEVQMTDFNDRSVVMGEFEDAITAHPEANIIGGTGSYSTLPAYEVLKSIGRGTVETELIVGIEGSYEEYKLIMDPNNAYKYTCGLTPGSAGINNMEFTIKVLNGELKPDAFKRVTLEQKVLGPDSDWDTYFQDEWNISLSDLEAGAN